MSVLFYCACLGLPFLGIRWMEKRLSVLGVFSDLFFALQMSVLLWLSIVLLPVATPFIFAGLLWLFPMLSLADVWLHKQSGIRLRFSFFGHVRVAGSFWDSGIAMGLSKWMLIFALWGTASCGLSFVMTSWLRLSPQDGTFLWVFFGVSALVLIGLDRKASPMDAYISHHLLILEEKELVKLLFRSKEEVKVSAAEVRKWLPSGEEYLLLHDNYPLLRLGQGFLGKSHFSTGCKKKERPHIIFMSLESFRACGIPILDSFRPIQGLAPCFEQLARQGILWRNFYSASTRSCKALLATLYGIPPQVEDTIFTNLPTFSLRGLPDILKSRGYINAYLHNGNIDFDRQEEFLQNHGFDIVHGRQKLRAVFKGEVESSGWGVHDEYLMRYARDFLLEKEKVGLSCFLYLFTVSNHHPWLLPPGCTKRSFMTTKGMNEAPFLQTMHYTDRWMGWFIEELRVQGLLEKSLIFIYGDHGQPLGERGELFQHREGIYEEGVRVPLLLLGKGVEPKIIDEIASQIDLLPTVLDTLGIEGVHHSIGRSLRKEARESEALFFAPFFPKVAGCRRGRYKLIHNPVSCEDELFDLENDPGEMDNVACKEKELTAHLRARILEQRTLFEGLYSTSSFAPTHNEKKGVDIDLSSRQDLEDEELISLLRHVQPVSLILNGALRLSDEGLKGIATCCSGLRRLSLKDCPRITECGLLSLVSYLPSLRTLELVSCLNIHFLSLAPFWQGIPSLNRLILKDQPFLTDEGVHVIANHVHYVEEIHLLDCTSITEVAVKELQGKRKVVWRNA